jgi:hypothetical protein
MTESLTVKCPACSHEFALSEGILSSVRADLSRELQGNLRHREEDLAARLQAFRDDQAALKRQQSELEAQVFARVEERVRQETTAIRAKAEEEALRKAMEDQSLAMQALRTERDEKDAALKKARQEQLALLEEKRKLAEAKEELELETRRRMDAEREKIREEARKKADEESRLKVADKEKVIADLQVKLQELQRKAEQGSMQTQGEVLEQDFEQQLRRAFPLDRVTPVSTGARGADVSLEVISRTGRRCGTVLFETKRTKAWQDPWVPKLLGDVRAARADIGVVVTETMPKDIDRFGLKEGVWVTDFASAIPLAHALRASLHEVMVAKGLQEGAKEKRELLYDYLTGNEFRQRVQLMMDAFRRMRVDLDKERGYFTRCLNRREKQIGILIETMAGMHGDVQALSGGAVQDIPALEAGEEASDLEDAVR